MPKTLSSPMTLDVLMASKIPATLTTPKIPNRRKRPFCYKRGRGNEQSTWRGPKGSSIWLLGQCWHRNYGLQETSKDGEGKFTPP